MKRQLYDDLSPEVVTESLMKSEAMRQEVKVLDMILRSVEPSKQESAFQRCLLSSAKTPEAGTTLKFLWSVSKAEVKHNADDFSGAVEAFQESLRTIFDGEARYFSSEFYNPYYIAKFRPKDSWKLHMDMAMCCCSTAHSYMALENYAECLKWFDEIEVLRGCLDLRFANGNETYKTLSYFLDHMRARLATAETLALLGNTGTAAYYSEQCRIYRIPRYLIFQSGVKDILEWSKSHTCLWIRHPDLKFVDNWDVESALMQLRGIWSKSFVRSEFRPPGRRFSANWVWHSRLYIHGGAAVSKSKSKTLYDIWCIDLKKMDKWIRLPDVPCKYHYLAWHGSKAVVYGDYAWMFTGRLDILRFNMLSESWDIVTSKAPISKGQTWPYINQVLQDSSVALLDQFMYVFGGDTHGKSEGSDVFVVLDLKSLQWRYLGDSSLFKDSQYPGKHWPPPRRKAGCWIAPRGRRFYLMYGTRSFEFRGYGERDDTDSSNEPYCTDLWSYSIDH